MYYVLQLSLTGCRLELKASDGPCNSLKCACTCAFTLIQGGRTGQTRADSLQSYGGMYDNVVLYQSK